MPVIESFVMFYMDIISGSFFIPCSNDKCCSFDLFNFQKHSFSWISVWILLRSNEGIYEKLYFHSYFYGSLFAKLYDICLFISVRCDVMTDLELSCFSSIFRRISSFKCFSRLKLMQIYILESLHVSA